MANDTPQAGLDQKLIGQKIHTVRIRAGLNIEEVSASIGITPEILSQIEAGQHDVTLPQLEILALICNVKISEFWSADALETKKIDYPTLQIINLRQRIIGALLKQTRTEAGKSEADVAALLNISAEQLAQYELGQAEIPLQQLNALRNHFGITFSYFLDHSSAVKKGGFNQELTVLDEVVEFTQLPQDVREFLANPANLLYLNIAMKLSELSVDTLRGLAEGLLEVTY
ncbi:helix-turn-helix transcriptional regulator [Anaerolineales bacterium HSG6]|nr:helix-turn-helix transcriptional regulator [Anaerolineales bacterium HSG6]MDM8531669.1 helix-turn-helix transcriptional regulator [Anaerolineales bacterium HSG25]